MRFLPKTLCLIVLAASLGCPLLPKTILEFTSADVGGNNGPIAFDDAADGAPAAGELEGDGASVARAVVEPDIIRRDGSLLYILNQYRGLTIADLDTEEILSQVSTRGYPRDLYIEAGRAYVLVSYAQDVTVDNDGVFSTTATDSRLYVIDVTDPRAANIRSTFDLTGDLVDSRLVGHVLYAVTSQYGGYYFGPGPVFLDGEGAETRPDGTVSSDGETGGGDPNTDVTGSGGAISGTEPDSDASGSSGGSPGDGNDTAPEPGNDPDGGDTGAPPDIFVSSTLVTSIDVSDPNNAVIADELSFDGQGHVIQATSEAIFVVANDGYGSQTEITYIDISDPSGALAVVGAALVRGYVADRFKLDAWEGVLRVVSIDWTQGARVYLTTIDLADLSTLAEIEIEGAAGESLFATRFDGARAYVVTFFVVDPLFVLDLSDPTNPELLGVLEVPGYSTHIEPLGDLLVALGVDDTDGRRVSVSLFDVAGAPTLIDRVSFGEEWSWSNAFNDVKAFTVLDDVIIAPFSGWTSDYGGFERLQFISYSRDDLELRGSVDLDGTILRSFEYAERYYGVTTEQLAVIDGPDLDDLAVTHTLTLAEYVADFIEVSDELAVEIVSRFNDAATLVRTLDGAGETLGEVFVEVGVYDAVHVNGDTLVLVGTIWDETTRYEVAMIDLSEPGSPTVTNTVPVEVQPYFGYYFDSYVRDGALQEGDIAVDAAAKISFAPGYGFYDGGLTETSWILGDSLILRCFAEQFDQVFGQAESREGVAVVDLVSASWTVTLGFGYERVDSVSTSGGRLYVGSKEVSASENGLPLCAYFIREIDVEARVSGPAANVPGAFVQYDAGTDILTLRDYRWEQDGILTRTLETVSWDGSEFVTPIQSLELPANGNRLVPTDGFVYVDSYVDGFAIQAVKIGVGGQMSLSSAVVVTNSWGSLLGARDGDVVVSAVGSVLAHYDFSGDGELVDYIEVNGAPSSVRFGRATAYAALGYWGVARLPL